MDRKKVWGVKCTILSCGKTKRNFPDLKFFRFPSMDKNLLKKWTDVCKISNDMNLKSRYICACHFHANEIGGKRLKRNVVPSLNINHENKEIEEENSPIIFNGKCYGKYSKDELEYNELPQLEPQYMSVDNEDIFPHTFCKNCLKFQKNCEFYRRKYNELLKKVRKLKHSKREKPKRYMVNLNENKIKNLCMEKNEEPIYRIINNIPNISSNAKTLCKMILKKKSKRIRWSENEKNLSLSMHYKSPTAYKYLRDTIDLNLPSSSSINRWQPVKYLNPGFNKQIFEKLKSIAENLNLESKISSLIWDEICIRKELVYDQHTDEVVGFYDDGNKKLKVPAKYICVFMIRGLFANWKYIVSYYASDKPINSDKLIEIVKTNIDYCNDIGFSIRNITCDQSSSNRSCFNKLNVTTNDPYFLHNSSKIFACYDFPHLMKSARNLLIKRNISCEDGVVSWKCVEELYVAEKEKSTKMCCKLTSKHVWPNTWQKMKVSYAANVFSHTVKSAIQTAYDLGVFSENVSSTAVSTSKFFEVMNNVFDCLNSKSPYHRNIYKSGLRKEGAVREYLENIIPYFEKISFESDRKNYWVKGIILTIKSCLQLSQNILDEFPDKQFFLTYKLNQDPLENMFSLIRSHGGCNNNPCLFTFNRIIAKIVSHKVSTFACDSSNCQEDNEDFPFDFKTYDDDQPTSKYHENGNNNEEIENIDVMEKEEGDDIEFLSYEIIEDDLLIEETSLRYFVGFVAHKIMKKTNCQLCQNVMIRKGETVSLQTNTEMFLFHKNYSKTSDFGKMNAPTDVFFELSKIHLKVFKTVTKIMPEIKNIKQKIIDLCVEETKKTDCSWFSEENPCFKHHINVLEYFLLILLRKFCKWETDKLGKMEAEGNNRKIKIIKQ